MTTATVPISHPATKSEVVPELVLVDAVESAGAAEAVSRTTDPEREIFSPPESTVAKELDSATETAPLKPTPDLNAIFAAALSAQKNGNIGEAIACYSKIIKLNPQIVEAYVNRAAARESTGDLDLALEDLDSALALRPEFMAYRNRGSVYFKKRDFEQAVRDYTTALEIDSNNATAYIYRGLAFINLRRHERANRDFSYALALDPCNAIAHTHIGIVHAVTGDHDNAIKNFNHALKADPNYPFVFFSRGASYSAKGDDDSAERDFSKAIELNPDFSDAYRARSLVFMTRGEYDRALQDVNNALRLAPEDPYAHHVRGSVYLEKGDFDEAIQEFDQSLEQVPENYLAYSSRGIAYERKGDFARAMPDYDRALSIRPEKLTYANRGIAQLRFSEWDRARSDLLSARNMGLDLVSFFRDGHRDIDAFEERHNLKLPQDIVDLVTVEEAPEPSAGESILEIFRKARESVPDAAYDRLPSDGSRNYKYYLYGWPKE